MLLMQLLQSQFKDVWRQLQQDRIGGWSSSVTADDEPLPLLVIRPYLQQSSGTATRNTASSSASNKQVQYISCTCIKESTSAIA
jgi:hypothetical protein